SRRVVPTEIAEDAFTAECRYLIEVVIRGLRGVDLHLHNVVAIYQQFQDVEVVDFHGISKSLCAEINSPRLAVNTGINPSGGFIRIGTKRLTRICFRGVGRYIEGSVDFALNPVAVYCYGLQATLQYLSCHDCIFLTVSLTFVSSPPLVSSNFVFPFFALPSTRAVY